MAEAERIVKVQKLLSNVVAGAVRHCLREQRGQIVDDTLIHDAAHNINREAVALFTTGMNKIIAEAEAEDEALAKSGRES